MLQLLYFFATDRRNLAAASVQELLAGARPISKTWQSALACRKRESLVATVHVVDDCDRPMKLIYVAISDRVASCETEYGKREQRPIVHEV